MNRSQFYDQSQDRTYDDLWAQRHALYAIGQLAEDILGSTAGWVTGLAATQTTSPSMTINIAAGDIYSLAAVDSTAYGSLLADNDLTMQQGFAAAQTVTLSTTGIGAGQSRYTLIQASFSQTDDIPGDDPTGGLLNYLNADDPNNPLAAVWSGPNNSGTTQNTRRKGVCVISTVNGTVATTGSEVPPNPSGGAVPLYLVDLAFGQSTITNSEILPAGPTAGTNVPGNYAATPTLDGIVQKATCRTYVGNPNGNVAGLAPGALFSGSPPTTCWDSSDNQLWVCSVSGPASVAIWVGTSGRTRLTNNTNFYVATTGSDSTGNGTSAKPWATLQKAWNVIQNNYDLNGFTATVNVATGTYSAGLIAAGPVSGSIGTGSVVFLGNIGTPTNCIISVASGAAISAAAAAQLTVEGFELVSGSVSSAGGVVVAQQAAQLALQNFQFTGAGGGNQISVATAANIFVNGNFTMSGGGLTHCLISGGRYIISSGVTVTISGSPTWVTCFAQVSDLGSFACGGATFSGASTGTRYQVSVNGIIDTGGGGATFLPGNSSGSSSTGGQYV